MKERGKKAVESYNNVDMEFYSTSSSDLPCKRHPSSSSVGICAYCLKDRLVKLVCSDCGEQRLSSCSCSEISSNRNSCTVEVGSVGRVSFLIENERSEVPQTQSQSQSQSQTHSKPKAQEKTGEVVMLKRSSSSCVEIKRSGFWRIGRLFRKKREKGCERMSVAGDQCDEKSDLWVVDYTGVSRSRSLCSFRGGGLFGSEDGGDLVVSAARSSVSGARNSGVNGGLYLDSGRRSGFSEAEPRKSGFDGEKKECVLSESEKAGTDFKGVKRVGLLELDSGSKGANRRVFSLKESDFNGMDDSGFIDLKLDYSLESSKPEFSAVKMDSESAFGGSMRGVDFVSHECRGSFGNFVGDGSFSNGGSCRITVNDRGIKRGRKSLKGWRWIFRHHPSWGSGKKKDEDLMFKT